MVPYDSIVDRVSVSEGQRTFFCPPGQNEQTWGPWSVSPPESETFFYEPERFSSERKPPGDDYQRVFPPRGNEILMSDYYARSTRTVDHLISRPRVQRFWNKWATYHGTTCCETDEKQYDMSWTERWSYDRLSTEVPIVSTSGHTVSSSQIRSAMQATEAQSFAASFTGVDILTELAEAGETLTFFANGVRTVSHLLRGLRNNDPKTFVEGWDKNSKDLFKLGRPFQILARSWLSLQYAILPLVFTYRDVNEELAQADQKFRTDRATRLITLDSNAPIGDLPDRYVYQSSSGTVTVRTTVKAGWNGSRLHRLFDRSAFNPFVTAWELIPYSFVADWFFNVGDTIRATTTVDLSSVRKACTSVKRDLLETYYYVDTSSDTSNAGWGSNPCHPAATRSYTFTRSNHDVLREVYTQSYDRVLTQGPSAVPRFDPSLDWRKIVTAVALTVDPSLKTLRSLRNPWR